jgi:hypothetical protein
MKLFIKDLNDYFEILIDIFNHGKLKGLFTWVWLLGGTSHQLDFFLAELQIFISISLRVREI